jgi:RNA polymerase sigma-70 factor, ECF subfamily
MGSPADKLSEAARPQESSHFEAVYDAHFAFVWRTLRHLGVADAQRDDAAQDVFLVVHDKLDGFEGRSSLKTWLFGITHLVALTYLRRERRHPSGALAQEPAASAQSSPYERARDAEAARFLQGFLATLDHGQRAVFVMAELEEMTAPEMAEALGVKLNTVYSRLRLARSAFEKALARSEFSK